MNKNLVIKLDSKDNMVVALVEILKDQEIIVDENKCKALDVIPLGHKMAVRDIEADENIIKYGYAIGHAKVKIRAGEWVHTHNCDTNLKGKIKYKYTPNKVLTKQTENCKDMFKGYLREDGEVGIRNEIWIIPTVGCVNHTIKTLQDEAQKRYGHLCDGIFAFPHTAGCSQLGIDHERTQRLLAGIIRHPNAGGVLVVSLGCENNNLENFIPILGDYDNNRVKFLVTQDATEEVEDGLKLIGELAGHISRYKRQMVHASRLVIGLKCGASDSFSGLTANPLCGMITDRITGMNGSAVMTEVPEMFGAESILMNRASIETFHRIKDFINSFKQYYINYGQPIYENPSPGNKAGGITTLEEKSLGCIQKGGAATVTDVLDYGEPCNVAGLSLLNGPGNDSVSITNLLASGVHLILFTTGRGNPLGTAVPAIKISSNSVLFKKKENWIDFDSGGLLYSDSFDELRNKLWDFILEVASGKIITKNEISGNREISIFKDGVLL